MAAKAALYLAMRNAHMKQADLARRLGCDEKEVRLTPEVPGSSPAGPATYLVTPKPKAAPTAIPSRNKVIAQPIPAR